MRELRKRAAHETHLAQVALRARRTLGVTRRAKDPEGNSARGVRGDRGDARGRLLESGSEKNADARRHIAHAKDVELRMRNLPWVVCTTHGGGGILLSLDQARKAMKRNAATGSACEGEGDQGGEGGDAALEAGAMTTDNTSRRGYEALQRIVDGNPHRRKKGGGVSVSVGGGRDTHSLNVSDARVRNRGLRNTIGQHCSSVRNRRVMSLQQERRGSLFCLTTQRRHSSTNLRTMSHRLEEQTCAGVSTTCSSRSLSRKFHVSSRLQQPAPMLTPSKTQSTACPAKKEVSQDPEQRLPQSDPSATTVGTGLREYLSACSTLGIHPMTRVISQLASSEGQMQGLGLGPVGGAALAAALSANHVMTSLDVRDNELGPMGLAALLTTLTHKNSAVSRLDLGKNRMDNNAAALLAARIAAASNRQSKYVKGTGGGARDDGTRLTPPLTDVCLNDCHIDDNALRHLALALEKHRGLAPVPDMPPGVEISTSSLRSLTHLSLAGNVIGNVGAAHLGRALAVNHGLVRLNLNWNRIGPAGAAALADGLAENRHLEYLSLAWNGLGDTGGVALGDMLRHNRGLRTLDMSHCRLGAAVFIAIAHAVSPPRANRTLETLCLNNNPCREEGGRSLIAALTTCSGSLKVSMEGCAFIVAGSRRQIIVPTIRPLTRGGTPASRTGKDHSRAGSSGKMNNDAPTDGDIKGRFTHASATWQGETPGHLPSQMSEVELHALVNQLGTDRLSDFEQLRQLEMFLQPHRLSVAQGRSVLAAFGGIAGPERLAAALAMHGRLTDPDDVYMLFNSPRENWRLRESLGVHVHFRAINPTGRYHLNLAVAVDRMVAQRLMESAIAESQVWTPRGPCWRNVRVNGRHLSSTDSDAVSSLDTKTGIPKQWLHADHDVPNHGTLCFDFASDVEPPKDATPISDDALQCLLIERGIAHCISGELMDPGSMWFPAGGGACALCALREVSPLMWLSAHQALRILSIFEPGVGERVEAVVTLISRVVPVHSRRLLLRGLDAVEQCHLGYRLGWSRLVGTKGPPPTARYRLDLSRPDDVEFTRRVVSAVTSVNGMQCVHNVLVNGRRLPTVTDSTLWSVVATETTSPVLEFDLLSHVDIWDFLETELGQGYGAVGKGNKLPSPGILVRLASLLSFRRAYSVHDAWIRLMPGVSRGLAAGKCGGSAKWVRTSAAVLRRSANLAVHPSTPSAWSRRRRMSSASFAPAPGSSTGEANASVKASTSAVPGADMTPGERTIPEHADAERKDSGERTDESDGADEEGKDDEEDEAMPGAAAVATAAELEHLVIGGEELIDRGAGAAKVPRGENGGSGASSVRHVAMAGGGDAYSCVDAKRVVGRAEARGRRTPGAVGVPGTDHRGHNRNDRAASMFMFDAGDESADRARVETVAATVAAAMTGDPRDPETRLAFEEAAAAALGGARLYAWQVAWDDHLVRTVRAEAAHLPPNETPLQQVFKLLDADGGGTLSLREFREGEREVLGLPVPPQVLEPYFRGTHSEWEGLMTWEMFEAMCMREYADMVLEDDPNAAAAARGRRFAGRRMTPR